MHSASRRTSDKLSFGECRCKIVACDGGFFNIHNLLDVTANRLEQVMAMISR